MPGILLHQPASILRTLLVSLGVGANPSPTAVWPIQDTSEPDAPDNSITIYDTQGRTQGRIQFTGETQEIHGIQIRIRAASSTVGWAKARSIARVLDVEILRNLVTVEGSVYLVQAVTRTSDVLSLGKETPNSKRSVFTINALMSVRNT